MKNPAWRANLHDRQESRKKRKAAELAALFCARRAAGSCPLFFWLRGRTILAQSFFPSLSPSRLRQVVRSVPIIGKQVVIGNALVNLAFIQEQK
jgi:hypothetical protein